MGENELGQGLAHMMAAPANLSGQGMLDNSIIAERDSLRAEVERLTKERDAAIATADATIADLNRLRKGRGYGRDGEIHSVVHVRMGSDIPRSKINLAMADTLDPRLGTPQPEGEPVGPRHMRRWVPIL